MSETGSFIADNDAADIRQRMSAAKKQKQFWKRTRVEWNILKSVEFVE